jgi:hypothetical protein
VLRGEDNKFLISRLLIVEEILQELIIGYASPLEHGVKGIKDIKGIKYNDFFPR